MEKKQRFGGRSSWQRRNGCTKSLGRVSALWSKSRGSQHLWSRVQRRQVMNASGVRARPNLVIGLGKHTAFILGTTDEWWTEKSVTWGVDYSNQCGEDTLGCRASLIRLLLGTQAWVYLPEMPSGLVWGAGSQARSSCGSAGMRRPFLQIVSSV